MKALKCDFCDSNLVLDDSREFAVCEFCGTKYMASTLRAKIQEINVTVTVSGAVETTGDAEKERLLKNATTFYDIGEINKALMLYRNITEEYPDCKEAWEKSLNIIVDQGLCVYVSSNCRGETIGTTNSSYVIIPEIIRHCNILSHLTNDDSFVEKYRGRLFNNICQGKTFLSYSIADLEPLFTPDQIKYIKTQSEINAKLVNSLNSKHSLNFKQEIYDDYKKYYKCLSYIGIIIKIEYETDVRKETMTIKAKKNANTQELKEQICIQQNERKRMGVCQYCGGQFRGVFSKVCCLCYRPKDY